MKKLSSLIICLIVALTSLPAFAYSYSDESYPLYRIWTVVADNQLYMYPVAGSSGQPTCAYKKGTLLRVTDWYVYGSSTYCYAVGPDGQEGYVRKSCLLRYYDYDDGSLASYTVNSTHYESGAYRLYMYPTPSASTDPVGVAGYVNGTVLKVVDWNVDKTYCYAVGPDGYCGFVRKSWLEYKSGSVPSSDLTPTDYYWPGSAKNSGSSSSSSSSSGSSSSSQSSGSQGGSTLTPPAGYGNNAYGNNGYAGFTTNNNLYSVSASSYYTSQNSQCDPSKAVDNDPYTSWDAYGEYEGAWIELASLNGPKTISGFRIQNGNRKRNSSSSLYFYRYSRVRGFSLYVDGIYVMSGRLDDTSDWQNVALGYQITGTSFRIYIDSVYQGTGTPASFYGVSIADILLM